MRTSLRFLAPLAVFLLLAAFLGVGLKRDPGEVPSALIGRPAPDFALPALNDAGRKITRADMLGRVWVLNVWASWCAPCREELPVLLDFAQSRRVPVYGLNYKDQRSAALGWLAQWGNPYDASLFDEQGRTGIDFGVYGVPETFVIDRQGVVRLRHVGVLTQDVIRTRIEPLLKELHA